MYERKKLSVIIISGNEEKNIHDCLESVKWADEIILVDSESKDRTVEIAKDYTSNVFIHPWEGFAEQKIFSLSKANHDWILSIDADERVSNELRIEIENVLLNPSSNSGFFIPRENFFLGKMIRSCFWYPDHQLRLFLKNKARMSARKVHEAFEVDGNTGNLKGDLIHYTHENLTDTIKKINEYSSLEAEEKVDNKKVKPRDLILHPTAAFLNHFISRKGYKDGVYGLMVSLIHMMTNMMKYMKIWELQNRKKRPERIE